MDCRWPRYTGEPEILYRACFGYRFTRYELCKRLYKRNGRERERKWLILQIKKRF